MRPLLLRQSPMLLIAACMWASACAPVTMHLDPVPVACEGVTAGRAIAWFEPGTSRDRASLAAWCSAVGPPVDDQPAMRADGGGVHPLVVVSWNVGIGKGRLVEFVSALRVSEAPDADVVVLVQEAYRAGNVPVTCAPGSRRARRHTSTPRGEAIDAAATALGMHVLYVPSMRNGRDCSEVPREDRGNAILSTLPLEEPTAIELPYAQQRRVAVAATVQSRGRAIRVVSVHFDTLRGRRRQAQGLVDALGRLPARDGVIVGGDFNQVGFGAGVRHLRRHFTEVHCGDFATHNFPALRLDRVFTSGLSQPVSCTTSPRPHGSDHWPLVAHIDASGK